MIFTIIIGAHIFGYFVTLTMAPQALVSYVQGLEIGPGVVILILILIYILLGCILESVSMMLLTVPVFYPVMQALGFDLVWFGIVVVVVIEISLIPPPIGLNVFVLNAMLPDIKLTQIFRGVIPFFIADAVTIALLVAFPAIVLWLPSLAG